MSRSINMSNVRFGRLVAVKRVEDHIEPSGNRIFIWDCQCDCGNSVNVAGYLLRRGTTKSCGCLKREIDLTRLRSHGKSNTRLYKIWLMIKQRCTNPKNSAFMRYGGRGIEMCDEWSTNYLNFYNWAMENGWDDKKDLNEQSIDRIDVNGNYEPSNCRFSDRITQANNTRSNHFITYQGKTHTVAEWSRITGVNYHTLLTRINSGMSVEKSLYGGKYENHNKKIKVN